ncbi:hypothetical protein [Olleya sp. Bg11-27]|nr:hypothetical protein [Olleya sp. Bg11-27]
MIFNALLSVFGTKNTSDKKSTGSAARHRYIAERYHERAIINRYFK